MSDDIDQADAFTALWAEAKILFLAKDFPEYGSAAWRDLTPDSPRRLAAALEAAELWRRYVAEEDPLRWIAEATKPRPPLHTLPDRPTIEAARKPKPAHQLAATPGWPAIAVPGGGGRYLAYEQKKEAA
ncbi:MAG: hypothetical protein JWO67_1443 [Streptosporangiaceae bacterium]|nr:hypothetical protein [Streptosporangiaceae bacterium]